VLEQIRIGYVPWRREFNPAINIQSDKRHRPMGKRKRRECVPPSCTCKMGSDSDPMAVLNDACQVRGIEQPACSGFRQFSRRSPTVNLKRTDIHGGRKSGRYDSWKRRVTKP